MARLSWVKRWRGRTREELPTKKGGLDQKTSQETGVAKTAELYKSQRS